MYTTVRRFCVDEGEGAGGGREHPSQRNEAAHGSSYRIKARSKKKKREEIPAECKIALYKIPLDSVYTLSTSIQGLHYVGIPAVKIFRVYW